jgi:hypothetical protein
MKNDTFQPWTYEGYWNVVLGDCRTAAQVVSEFALEGANEASLNEWLIQAEREAWRAGVEYSAYRPNKGQEWSDNVLEPWALFHARAMLALLAVSSGGAS